jgi:hypothetical protein
MSESRTAKLPPVKNTSGEGFAVEDHVAAWLACHLLTGIPWPNPQAGVIEAINCQVRQDGWHFDDFIVELRANGEARRCACSVKSFPVFGRKGAPADFAKVTWKEWLGRGGSPFKPYRDSIAVFSAPHESAVREAWQGLLDLAHAEISPEVLAKRQRDGAEPSHLKRAAYSSMRCPKDIDSAAYDDSTETARLLHNFFLQEQDFNHSDSQSLKEALLFCQQALEDSARSQALELWHQILIYAAETRKKGGRISLPSLLTRLTCSFSLKQSPHYAEEWQRILKDSEQQMNGLPTKIGGTFFVQRQDLLGSMLENLSKKQVVWLVGDSGFGKTVLAKSWATADEKSVAVWVKALDLSAIGGLIVRWNLRHTVSELFQNGAKSVRLVIDGLDKCFDEGGFNEAALLLKAVMTENARFGCHIVLTSNPEDLGRVHRELIRRGLTLDLCQILVDRFTDQEVWEVCEHIPAMRPLWNRSHLRLILGWPKALDIAASHWRSSAVPQWTCESDFARWFWQTAISCDQPLNIRESVLRKLACVLADRLLARVKLEAFETEECAALSSLARENHVIIDQQSQTVRFAHDLIGDWARLREIQIQDSRVASFIKERLQSPLWHRPLRFYALDLIERTSTATEWKRLFDAFSTDEPASQIAKNLLLEAPIFALHQGTVLEQLWPSFIAEKGELLRRFLRQFLRVATVPDERYVELFRDKNPKLQLDASVRFRIPWAPLWPGVLKFLSHHEADVIHHAREEVADVCLLWLQLHEATNSGMKAAANLATAAARLLYRSGDHGNFHGHDASPEEKVYAALMAAAPILPNDVELLVLKLSGRRGPDPEDNLNAEEDNYSRSVFAPRYGPPRPWPEGPQVQCNPDFRKAFMNLNWPSSLMATLPDVAEQVMFAVLLNIPLEGSSPRDDWYSDLDEHGFNSGDLRSGYAFWTNGSFLTFLRLQPKIGLSAIIRLVNFATDRCLELGPDVREPIRMPIIVNDETRIWQGHRYSYLWHQGHVFGPRVVCCALISLEKWLYMLMDEGISINQSLSTILQESRSIALAAVLVCVGKRQPDLFLTVLKPLLTSPEIFWFEEIIEHCGEGNFRASMIGDWTGSIRETLREWVEMPHRKTDLGRLVLEKLFNDPEWRELWKEIRPAWEERLKAGAKNPAPAWLPRMVAQFDLSNWKPEASQEGVQITFKPPSNLPQPSAQELKNFDRYQKLTLLPFQCSQILKGTAECSIEQLGDWWNDVAAIRKLKVPQEHVGLQNIEDALCGIVAVAIVRHRTWLSETPEREREAIRILVEVGENPPQKFWLVENDHADFTWDIFAAWALTVLWLECPEEPFLRQAVGSFSIWEREIVVEKVLHVAATRRRELGKHFDMLFAHAIQFAPAKHRIFMGRQFPQFQFDANGWIREHVMAFVESRTKALPLSWIEIAEPQPWRGSQTSGMDVGHLAAALGWAGDLMTATDVRDRSQSIEFHRQALLCAVRRIHNLRERDPKIAEEIHDTQERSAFKDEQALLDQVAAVLARLNSDEEHVLLWEPVLSLGMDGHRWITWFVSHWLIEANRRDEVAPGFIEQWIEMLEFAETSPTWQTPYRRYGHSDCWEYLLGLSPFGTEFWRIELRSAVETAWPFFERWGQRNLHSEHAACTFIQFLKAPAATSKRLDGLCLLKKNVKMDDDSFWEEMATQNVFAAFLKMLLEQSWPTVMHSAENRDAFMVFALKLTALQHPLGTEVTTIAAKRMGEVDTHF